MGSCPLTLPKSETPKDRKTKAQVGSLLVERPANTMSRECQKRHHCIITARLLKVLRERRRFERSTGPRKRLLSAPSFVNKTFRSQLTAPSSCFSFSIHSEHKALSSTNKPRFPRRAAKRKDRRGRRAMPSQGSLHLLLLKPN